MTLGVLEDHLVNLAMSCVPSVMILAIILESIPRCHLVSRYSIPGFEPEIHSSHLMLIVFARSFRILVTLRQSSRSVVFPS